jgi:hypothetical protein
LTEPPSLDADTHGFTHKVSILLFYVHGAVMTTELKMGDDGEVIENAESKPRKRKASPKYVLERPLRRTLISLFIMASGLIGGFGAAVWFLSRSSVAPTESQPIEAMALSPDSQILAYSVLEPGNSNIYAVYLQPLDAQYHAQGNPKRLTAEAQPIDVLLFSPHKTLLLTESHRPEQIVQVLNLNSGAVLTSVQGSHAGFQNEDTLIYLRNDSTVQQRSISQGTDTVVNDSQNIHDLVLDTSGAHLAMLIGVEGRDQVHVGQFGAQLQSPLPDSQVVNYFNGGEMNKVALTPDDRYILASGDKGFLYHNLVIPGDTHIITSLLYGAVSQFAVSPSSVRVALGLSKQIAILQLDNLPTQTTPEWRQVDLIDAFNSPITGLVFTSDSAHLIIANADGNLALWDVFGRKTYNYPVGGS